MPTPPLWHPQLLIVTVSLGLCFAVPAKATWPPSSEVDVASNPWLGTFPGSGVPLS